MITTLLLLLPALAQDAPPPDAAPAETEAAPAETEAAPAETEAAPAETEAAPAETEAAPEAEAETPAPADDPAPAPVGGQDEGGQDVAAPAEAAPSDDSVGTTETAETAAPAAQTAEAVQEAPPAPPPEEDTAASATAPDVLAIDASEFAQASDAANAIAAGEYETLEGLSPRQVRWLKPKRNRLPANARGSTDFTAYVLEFGEVEIGPTGLSVGALPRVQVGTVPALDVLGLWNGWAKVNPLRIGGFDLALNGAGFYLPLKGFNAYLISAGALASVQVLEPWSIHLGGNYNIARASGVPDLRGLSPLLSPLAGEELTEYGLQALHDDLYIDASAQFATVRLATDYRLNARDSIIAQAQAMVWASVDSDIDLPPILNMNEALDVNSEGQLRLQDAYIASIAYQAAWRRLTIRAGFGVSSQPGAWLIQSVKLNYRFGGETRRGQRGLRGDWRGNKDDKTRKKERQEAEDRGVWTPDQDNEIPREEQDTGGGAPDADPGEADETGAPETP